MSVAASVTASASTLPSPQKTQETLKEEGKVALQTRALQKKVLRFGPEPRPSCVRRGIMLALVVIFLPSLYCDLGSAHYSSYEIVIPTVVTAEGRGDPVEEASYVLFMQGQKHLLHLTVKRDYFVSNFPVFSYRNGVLGREMPFISRDCHYEGYIEGVPGSFVSVNTCSGLRGILMKAGKAYGIEPVEPSKRSEHVLYTMAQQSPVSCGVTSRDSPVASASGQPGSRKPHSPHTLSSLWAHTKYVEMFVVVNNQRFQMWGSNVSETVQRVMDVIALANSFTRGINTEVVLVGMEMWTEGDLVEVPEDLGVALGSFNSWRQEELSPRVKHDVAHMIVGHHPGGATGRAFLSGACSSEFAAAVESFHHEDALLSAALMVHELGHNLGIGHDHAACICEDRHFCLMHENVSKESGFSNCSSDSYYQFLHEHKGACLFNEPQHKGRRPSVTASASTLPSPQKTQETLKEEGKVALQTRALQKKVLRFGPEPRPSCVRRGIMLALVVIFLPSLYCDLGSAHYSSYEIVIPTVVTAEGRGDPVEEASYVLFMQGQKHLLHLTVKRDYFVSNFPVFSYRNGVLGREMPFISRDCHYEGYIEGVPGSFVSVNTCSGLRGILMKAGKAYGIEPVEPSKRSEHVLYTMAQQSPVSCGVTSRDSPVASASGQPGSRKPHSPHTLSSLWAHTKYVEMFVVVNNQRFQMWGSNVSETVQRVMDVIALANSFTRGINTEVVLVGMEMWTEGDLVEVPEDLGVALGSFNSWRQEELSPRVKHDVAHMIVGHHPGGATGRAFLSGACSSEFAAAVESFHHEDALLSAALMVHELGHNLGIGHDHAACICEDRHFCLMHENVSKESGFSNCSSDSYYQFLHEHKGACLFNEPQHKGRRLAASVTASASTLPSPQKTQETLKEEGKVALQTRALQKKVLRFGPEPRPSCVRRGIMLALVVIFLPSLYCDLGSAHYSSYEIVIPTVVTAEGRGDPVEEASYVLFMQGQKHLLHLTVKRDYFVSNFPVFSYRNGVLGREMPFISRDCHYEGYIEGVPGSFVSVNTCSGLRGILMKAGKAYGIEPVEPSKRSEHVLYTMAQQSPVSCGVTSRDSPVASASGQPGSRKPHSPHTLSSLWAHTKYVEMFVVVNNQRFQMWGSNVSETVQRVMDVIALANSFTRGINTEVVLVGMEMWTEGDLVEVPEDLGVALGSFNSWRQEELSPRVKHDVAHMIVGHHPGGATGRAFLSGACSSEFAAAVESFHHEDALLSAALMVHELGHNLGIGHDHAACICEDRHFCLMHENVSKESGFSNCSSDSYYQFLHEHKGACLFNEPQHKGRRRRDSVCGNGVLELGEQCDCGNQCADDPCCEYTCRLKGEAQCVPGPCCTTNCKFEPEGLTCRPALNECDLPEYCSGFSGTCPNDTYKLDGSLCQRVFHCINGSCRSRDSQCANIYGFSASSAPEECYTMLNTQGNRFGNCGHSPGASQPYTKCANENILCGKLICTGVFNLPAIKPQHTLIQVPHGDGYCWSMDAYTTTDISDEGDVSNGTYCAPDKVCTNSACGDYTEVQNECVPTDMCNGNGVCNNLNHCHCDYGYAPPDCKLSGNGGSVDSGSPSDVKETPAPGFGQNFTQNIKKEQRLLDTAIILGMIGLIILLIFSIICIITVCKGAQGPPPAPTEKPPEAEPTEAPLEKGAPEEEVPEEGAPEEGAPEEAAPEEAAPEEAAPEEGQEEEQEGEKEVITCSSKNTSAESLVHEDTPHFAALIAHEFGHNLEMKHDHVACKCNGQHLLAEEGFRLYTWIILQIPQFFKDNIFCHHIGVSVCDLHNTVMAPPSNASQIPTNKMAHLAKNIIATRNMWYWSAEFFDATERANWGKLRMAQTRSILIEFPYIYIDFTMIET
ncbi:Disintegrin and metalloproteinase domain-containing protein 1 [Galemys pyrenaicus]|uniref:Disintegrin and metalloproteinase domain-containing protein 1 n=1 Tax=Galemys pyrenaicus TaxID=202257 RepID=A0A8J6DLZ1_GALPY|nr:Disintegrin and metalloproteinase domain-containing protein 1 [Galemys pyrenaicus]